MACATAKIMGECFAYGRTGSFNTVHWRGGNCPLGSIGTSCYVVLEKKTSEAD